MRHRAQSTKSLHCLGIHNPWEDEGEREYVREGQEVQGPNPQPTQCRMTTEAREALNPGEHPLQFPYGCPRLLQTHQIPAASHVSRLLPAASLSLAVPLAKAFPSSVLILLVPGAQLTQQLLREGACPFPLQEEATSSLRAHPALSPCMKGPDLPDLRG